MKKFAIIVAGGTGSRMGENVPKQFLILDGKPVLMHSVLAFSDFDPHCEIIISLHPDLFGEWNDLCRNYGLNIKQQVVAGGETRFHSVKNGLAVVRGEGLVAVHDAARPVISKELIARVFKEAEEFSSAIPCVPVNETVRKVENGQVTLVDRTTLKITQTPEVFEAGLLRRAYEQEYQPGFTDDGSLLEAMGVNVHLTVGDHRNLKITLPGDLEIAGLHLSRMKLDL